MRGSKWDRSRRCPQRDPVASTNSPGEAPMLSETYTSFTISEKIFRCGPLFFILLAIREAGTERLRSPY